MRFYKRGKQPGKNAGKMQKKADMQKNTMCSRRVTIKKSTRTLHGDGQTRSKNVSYGVKNYDRKR